MASQSIRHPSVAERKARGSERYADQNEKDYESFVNAVRSGRLEVIEGL